VRDDVDRVVAEVLQPLLEADGGGVEVVSVDTTASPVEIVLHLTGAYRGCPSSPVVQRGVLEPVLAKALGRPIKVRLSPVAPFLTNEKAR
jgi:Fe-S cluster biogenesis protein NfuA